jgi:hypothetical protein
MHAWVNFNTYKQAISYLFPYITCRMTVVCAFLTMNVMLQANTYLDRDVWGCAVLQPPLVGFLVLLLPPPRPSPSTLLLLLSIFMYPLYKTFSLLLQTVLQPDLYWITLFFLPLPPSVYILILFILIRYCCTSELSDWSMVKAWSHQTERSNVCWKWAYVIFFSIS